MQLEKTDGQVRMSEKKKCSLNCGKYFMGVQWLRERENSCALSRKIKYQALDYLEQLLHHHGNALVTKKTADCFEVWRTHKVPVGTVDVGVSNVQRLKNRARCLLIDIRCSLVQCMKHIQVFGSISHELIMLLTDLGTIQVVRLDIGRLVPLRLLGEWNGCPHKPVP